MSQRIAILPLLFLAVALMSWPTASHGSRIGHLIRILKTASSYKVRLQVVITLGKIKDRKAVPALIGALSDENYTVRGVAATALGQIGDSRALPHLKRMARTERNSFVKSQVKKALRAMKRGGGPSPGSRFFVTVGKVTNKAQKGGRRLAKVLRKALLKEFSSVPGVVTPWSSRNPSPRELRKHKLKGFVLDGSILSLRRTQAGGSHEISCNIKVSLATYPGNSMKAFYSGGASMSVPQSSFKPEHAFQLYKEIVEGAAQGARMNIAQSYLSNQ